MPAAGLIEVKGLRELNRAFAKADRKLKKELHDDLVRVAAPVALDAQRRAVAEISHIGDKWQVMRVGVTQKLVYVAPKERGRKSRRNPSLKRPNLAPLLLDKAMIPALEANQAMIIAQLERLLDEVGREWERG